MDAARHDRQAADVEALVSDVTRFAGYDSPAALVRDASLTREEKISGLRTWRTMLVSGGTLTETAGEIRRQQVAEIDRALSELSRT